MSSFLYVYSDHSILECYNLFSGVELSMRSFFVMSRHSHSKNTGLETPEKVLLYVFNSPCLFMFSIVLECGQSVSEFLF